MLFLQTEKLIFIHIYFFLFAMSENLYNAFKTYENFKPAKNEKLERALKTLNGVIIPGLSEQFVEVEGYIVPKGYEEVVYGYFHDYLQFHMYNDVFQYAPRVLVVIQGLLSQVVPNCEPWCYESMTPLVLRFLNRKYKDVKFYKVIHVRYVWELIKICSSMEYQLYLDDKPDNLIEEDDDILNECKN